MSINQSTNQKSKGDFKREMGGGGVGGEPPSPLTAKKIFLEIGGKFDLQGSNEIFFEGTPWIKFRKMVNLLTLCYSYRNSENMDV